MEKVAVNKSQRSKAFVEGVYQKLEMGDADDLEANNLLKCGNGANLSSLLETASSCNKQQKLEIRNSMSTLQNSGTESTADVIGLSSVNTLHTFAEMWYRVFLWALFSSIFVHTAAALMAFTTLRKHKFGKFFPIFILVMGIIPPLTSGVVNSAAIAFVYRYSSFPMAPLYAFFWGVGQTALSACIGFTRILATL